MELKKTLIIIDQAAEERFEDLIGEISGHEGKVLHAFAPVAVIAEIPPGAVEFFRNSSGVILLTTERIGTGRQGGSEITEPVINAWNSILDHDMKNTDDSLKDLSWDAEGFLPPDPPGDIRKHLEDREKEEGFTV